MPDEPTYESVGISNILTLARANAKAKRTTLSAISRVAHSDGRCFDNLAKGCGSISLRKYEDVMLWLRDPMNWPDGATIPAPYEPWRQNGRRKGRAPTRNTPG